MRNLRNLITTNKHLSLFLTANLLALIFFIISYRGAVIQQVIDNDLVFVIFTFLCQISASGYLCRLIKKLKFETIKKNRVIKSLLGGLVLNLPVIFFLVFLASKIEFPINETQATFFYYFLTSVIGYFIFVCFVVLDFSFPTQSMVNWSIQDKRSSERRRVNAGIKSINRQFLQQSKITNPRYSYLPYNIHHRRK